MEIKKKGQLELGNMFLYISLILAIGFFVAVTIYLLSSIGGNTLTGTGSNTSNFIPLSSLNTLSPVGEGITSSSVQVYNETHLNFDGVDDYVLVVIPQSKAVYSFWFKNATTNWTSVIVNYDDIYINNSLDATWSYLPYYVSGENVTLGKFDASTFFNGSIDNFQVYESKLSSLEVETIYNESH